MLALSLLPRRNTGSGLLGSGFLWCSKYLIQSVIEKKGSWVCIIFYPARTRRPTSTHIPTPTSSQCPSSQTEKDFTLGTLRYNTYIYRLLLAKKRRATNTHYPMDRELTAVVLRVFHSRDIVKTEALEETLTS